MSILQDPLQSITSTLQQICIPMGFAHVRLGWPEPDFLNGDGNVPSLFVWAINDWDNSAIGSEGIIGHVVSEDEKTATVYREKQRKAYMLKLTLYAATTDELQQLAWAVESHLHANPRLQLGVPDIETAVFKYRAAQYPTDTVGGAHRRDLIYEVTARVIESRSEPLLKQVAAHELPTFEKGE